MARRYERPPGNVGTWQITPAARWIKSAIENDEAKLVFLAHAEERQLERRVSAGEARAAILSGTARAYEPEPGGGDAMRCRFQRTAQTRQITAIVEIADDDPNIYMITVWADPN